MKQLQRLDLVAAGGRGTRECVILFADLAGYSSMMSRDELGTLEFIVSCSQLIAEAGARHGGELVQVTGDGYLLLFERAGDAVEFGVELHHIVAKRQTGSEAPAQFRVGIHQGQVHVVNGSIHGHAVNVAARLQTEAVPGTCVISHAVYDRIEPCEGRFEAIGRPALKNIAERIALYRTHTGGGLPAVTDSVLISVLGTLNAQAGRMETRFRPSAKASALLGYLALAPGMRERTDKIARLISPDLALPAARRSIATCRRRLGQSLAAAGHVLFAGDGHVGLDEMRTVTDLERMLQDLRRGRVPEVLIGDPEWPSRILDGFDAVGPLYAGWLTVTRAGWQTRVLRELSEILDRHAPEHECCREAALAIIGLEPGNELASATLIRHHAARGNRAGALKEYTRIEKYLGHAHGLNPGAEVARAVEETRRGAAGPSGATRSDRPSIPIAHVSRRLLRIHIEPFPRALGAEGHLISGFRSELLANLARFREWSVSEGEAVPLALVGDAAPLWDYKLGGEFRPGFQPALQLRLSDLRLDRVVWSEEVLLDADRWSGLQHDIIARIAAHLDTYISADRLSNAISRAALDSTTHDVWLRAEQIFNRWSPQAADEAETMLRAVIDRDPSFAPAFSSLASFRNVRHVIRPGLPRDPENEREAHRLAGHAVELDPLDARNQLAVAWTAALTGDFDRALIHFDLAASLNPNSATTLISCAMGCAFTGQPQRGEALITHALRISPMLSDYQWCYIASVYFLVGRHEEALQAARRSGDRIVDNEGWIAATLVGLGRVEEAHAAFERLLEAVRPIWAGERSPTPESVLAWFTEAYPLRRAEDRRRLADSLAAAARRN